MPRRPDRRRHLAAGHKTPSSVVKELTVYGSFFAISLLQIMVLIPATLKAHNIIASMEAFKQDWAVDKVMKAR